jgi:hypothetical protein
MGLMDASMDIKSGCQIPTAMIQIHLCPEKDLGAQADLMAA